MADIKNDTHIHQDPVVVNEQPKTSAPAPIYAKHAVVTGTEKWQHDMWDCFAGPDNLCLKTTFCPCFVYGKTEHRRRDPTLTGYERINNDCLMWGGAQACCGLGWVFNFIRRGEIRSQYNIKGDQITDCLFGAFCGCCSLIQQEKEVIAQQTLRGGVNKDGYVMPSGGMHVQGGEVHH